MLEAIHTAAAAAASTAAAAAASTVAAVPNSTELKMELQSLMNQILDGEDHSLEITVEVLKILTALEELKKKSSDSLKVIDDNAIVPDEFKCPISRELMADPVVLATGQVRDCMCHSNFFFLRVSFQVLFSRIIFVEVMFQYSYMYKFRFLGDGLCEKFIFVLRNSACLYFGSSS